jgi:hypothetical protein
MPCFHPKEAWHGKDGGIVFNRYFAKIRESPPFHLPCNGCIGCRLEKTRTWAMRMLHESKMHKKNCFVTLTYDDKNLPFGGDLVPDHLRLFMKTLRKHKGRTRFYGCGEYGDENQRPHYHAILFGQDFTLGAKRCGGSEDAPLFNSPELSKLWNRGHCTAGYVSPQSCAYVARYVVKKINGPLAAAHYTVNNSGSDYQRRPEFSRMSRMPGIGQPYFEKYGLEACTHDAVIINGKPVPPAAYYLRLAAKSDKLCEQIPDIRRAERKLDDRQWNGETLVQEIKKRRVKKARMKRADNTPERLAVREEHATKLLQKRKL